MCLTLPLRVGLARGLEDNPRHISGEAICERRLGGLPWRDGNCPYRMSSISPQIRLVHNPQQQRFEVRIQGEVASVSYTRDGGRVVFDHTYVPEAFRGKGVAAALVRAALGEAREQHWQIVPQCSYVAAFIERHPEFASLVAAD